MLKPSGTGRHFDIDRLAKPVFIGLPMAVLILLILYPTFSLFRLMLSHYDVTYMRQPVLIGLANFTKIGSDMYFWDSLLNTVIIGVSAVLLELVLGLCLALLLMEEIPGSSVLRALFIVPMMIPAVVVGLNFKLIFDTFGPLNGFLQAIGLDRIPWLSDPTWARAAVVLSDVWQWTPFMFIILLAGLQSIPDELYDSAKVDGAVGWTLFRHITWPMLVPSATVAIAFRVMDVLRIFDIPFMMTNGGPSFATEVLSLYIFRTSFRFGSMSYAATLAFLMLIILSVTVNFITKATKLSTRLEWD